MKEGYHNIKWFTDRIGVYIAKINKGGYNPTYILVKDKTHAESLFKLQKLDGLNFTEFLYK